MPRADLLALTDDGLIQLSNAGLVKRAVREVAAGQGPALAEGADGTIEARFADGTLTRLATGRALADATCTCPAGGLCRHRVALVVAYRAAEAAAPAAAAAWDPGRLDGETFERGLNTSAKAELSRLLAAGLTIELERGAVPAARLPTATVRFLVPGEVTYARCDCAAGSGCAHVALAIRAFRQAGDATEARLGASTEVSPAGDIVDAVDRLLCGLLELGVVAGQAAHAGALDRLRRAAETRGATQCVLAVEELEQQIEAYAARNARYDELEVLALATELYARAKAGDAAALGIGQPYETAMGKARLVSLGARLRARGRDVTASLAVADTDTGATMVLERTFSSTEDDREAFIAALPKRQIVTGLQLAAAANGQILTNVARRRANGLLILGSGARGRTSLMPRDVIQSLPSPLRASNTADVARSLTERPPAMLRRRDRLGAIHLFDVEAVLGQAWSPGSQAWQAAVRLADEGGTLFLERPYDGGAPAALDALGAITEERYGALRQIIGTVRVEAGALVCDPWAVATDRFVVPDVEPCDHASATPSLAPASGPASTMEQTRAFLAGALHAGRRAFAASARESGSRLVASLVAAGYLAAATHIRRWLDGGQDICSRFGIAAIWIAAIIEDPGPPDPREPDDRV